MAYYPSKTPGLVKALHKQLIWSVKEKEKKIYLTFDDGPIPEVTPRVLDILKTYGAKATFFCIGDNVRKHPEVFDQLLKEGHAIGNHTFHHLNGWKTKDYTYFRNTLEASSLIPGKLFRPPYGKITFHQASVLSKRYKIVMWDVMSGDFDQNISGKKTLSNVINNAGPGSIVVFHDSLKASERMDYALPRALDYLSDKGYTFHVLNSELI